MGIVAVISIAMALIFADAITAWGMERAAVLVVAGEFYVIGVFSLILVGYCWPIVSTDSGNQVPYGLSPSKTPLRDQLQITAKRGPHAGYPTSIDIYRYVAPFTIALIALAYWFQYGNNMGRGFEAAIQLELWVQALLFTVMATCIVMANFLKMWAVAKRFVVDLGREFRNSP